MDAGRKLDALVAEKVMGWYVKDVVGDYAIGYPPERYTMGIDMDRQHIPYYSTAIAAAWLVVERFYQAGCAAWVEMDGHTGIRAGCTSDKGRFEVEGDTAPHAICLAALKAVGAL